jgi:cytochrome c peroxidase
MRVSRHTVAWLTVLLMPATTMAGDVPVPPEMRLEALPQRAQEPADNPCTPEKIRLGRLLFFDPILSATQTVACATCHHPKFAWADARPTPLGVGATGLGPARTLNGSAPASPLTRNAPSLLNVGFNGLVAGMTPDPKTAPMFWDSRVQGLEAQAQHPIRSRDEMRGDACLESEALSAATIRVREIAAYRELFHDAFSANAETAITADHLTKALAAFERTLVAGDSPFDRHLRGAGLPLTAQQERGMRIFQTAGCIQCHGGPMFSDFKLHFIGVSESPPDGRRELRTPTLRNLRQTAPYMHRGSLRTLDEVLAFYERLSDAASERLDGGDTAEHPPLDPLLKHLALNAEDFPDLTAFLEMLNDDGYDRSAPPKVPSGLPVPQ